MSPTGTEPPRPALAPTVGIGRPAVAAPPRTIALASCRHRRIGRPGAASRSRAGVAGPTFRSLARAVTRLASVPLRPAGPVRSRRLGPVAPPSPPRTAGTVGPPPLLGAGPSFARSAFALMIGRGRALTIRSATIPARAGAVAAVLRSSGVPIPARPGVVPIPSALARAAVAAPDQLGGHTRPFGTARAEDLDPLRISPGGLLGSQHGHNGDAIDLKLGLGPENVAGLGALREQPSVEDPFWLPSTGGPPGPRAVGSRACQLDLYATGHALTLLERDRSCAVIGPVL